MRALTVRRYQFTGMLYIPKIDVETSTGDVVLTFEKDIVFDFSGSGSSPRSVLFASEPFPTQAVITNVRNKYGDEILEGAEFTVTGVEPVLSPWGRSEGFHHLLAIKNAPTFGYEIERA